MEIVSSNRFPLDHHAEGKAEEEEEDGGEVKVLETKLKGLRFDQEEPGLGHSSFGLTKKLLRLEFKVITDIDLRNLFHSLYSSYESNGFTALKSLSVKWEKQQSSVNLTNSCFDDATEIEFYGDLNLFRDFRRKDFEGNTALHLSTPANTKQPQTLRVLLINELLDAKALNSGGSVTLDIPCDLPNSENMHVKFSKIGPKDGARACDLTNQRSKHNDDYSYRRLSNRSSDMSTVNSIIRSRNALLLIAIFFTAITFQVPFHFLGPKEGYVHTYMTDSIQVNKQYPLFPCTFLLFNSMVFIASVIMTLFLLHEFPFKPWPQISVLALFGSYMCSIKAISPNGARALLFISIPFSLLAAAGKLYGFARHNFT
ncbi:unnamed protein product [Camellia sinensis]